MADGGSLMSRKLSDSLLPDKKLISSSFDISNMLFGVSTRQPLPPLPRATTFGSALQLDSLDWLVVALLVMAVLLLPPLGGLLSCFMTTTVAAMIRRMTEMVMLLLLLLQGIVQCPLDWIMIWDLTNSGRGTDGVDSIT